MDKLDLMISQKEGEAQDLKNRLAVLEAELNALRLAAQLRPATTTSASPRTPRGAGGGRKKGAISQSWREILAEMYRRNTLFSYEDVHAIAHEQGNDIELNSVRDRVRNMVKTGLLAGSAEDGFHVTQEAAERFEFSSLTTDRGGDPANENEGAAAPLDANAGSAEDTSGVLNLQPRLHGQ